MDDVYESLTFIVLGVTWLTLFLRDRESLEADETLKSAINRHGVIRVRNLVSDIIVTKRLLTTERGARLINSFIKS